MLRLCRLSLARHVWWVAALLLLWLAPAGRAGAHGGGTPQLANEPAGPYLLSVWTDPDPARVGEAHVTVAISEPGADGTAGEPVLGAAVRVVWEPQGQTQAEPLGGLATHGQSINRLFYEADFALPAEGLWRVTVLVDGPAGSGSAAFDIQVLPPRAVNWPAVAGASVVVVLAVWLALKGRLGE